MENEDPKWEVCVRCYTFNHAPYITDTLKGFTMQQTDFPYVCCIVDDASTDGEQEVIKRFVTDNFDLKNPENSYVKEQDYGTLIYARHKTNNNCYFAVLLLKKNHYGSAKSKEKKRGYISEWEKSCRYEALCEGDDFWTDPLKLQKQVHFLEKNPDYSLCFHKVEIRHEGTKNVASINEDVLKKDYTAQEIFEKWIIPTCSAILRYDCYNYLPSHEDFIVGDNVLWATCLTRGKIRGMEDCMGVYRRVDTGWTALQNKSRSIKYNTKKRWIKHYKAMIDCFPDIDRTVFEDKMIKHMADISVIDISTLNKNSFKNFRVFYGDFGGRYLKQLAKSFYSTLKHRIKVDFKK